MSDFIIRFQGIELSAEQEQHIQDVIEQAALLTVFGPDGPPRHGANPGDPGGNNPGAPAGGGPGNPIGGHGIIIDKPSGWMGLRIVTTDDVVKDPTILKRVLVVSER